MGFTTSITLILLCAGNVVSNTFFMPGLHLEWDPSVGAMSTIPELGLLVKFVDGCDGTGTTPVDWEIAFELDALSGKPQTQSPHKPSQAWTSDTDTS